MTTTGGKDGLKPNVFRGSDWNNDDDKITTFETQTLFFLPLFLR
jgi:hypothetical protein